MEIEKMEGLSPEEIEHQYAVKSKGGRTFTLNDAEYANAVKFAAKHTECKIRSALSERFEYVFIPGGIGTVKVIKCLVCGIEENITDFDCW